ncbi:ATP-dependent zinc protease [Pseudomonas sp. NW5]|uniref:ATP-dependent zinc protease family protein n=1 Tax=Pseudomonas sp. NW5 TaxID=2934934 RepID=UPI0020215C0F|nr:ATP-dependent zinc protease [Pseudomonas sp. NW5]
MQRFAQPALVGLIEWIALPALGITALRAKIDTGAHTATLHASDFQPFEREGQAWLRFTAYTGSRRRPRTQTCEAPLVGLRDIRSATGQLQRRYVICTPMVLGPRCWPVEISLTCRREMRYRALIGARALIDGHLQVDPSLSYLQGRPQLPAPTTPSGVR